MVQQVAQLGCKLSASKATHAAQSTIANAIVPAILMTMWTGANIHKLRTRLGWTMEQMAQAMGVNYTTIWRWESAVLPQLPDWQSVILDRLATYADEWEATQRPQVAEQQAGDALKAILVAGGLIALAAALFAGAAASSKPGTKRKRRS